MESQTISAARSWVGTIIASRPSFPPGVTVPMDDIGKIPYMIEFAESTPIDETISWLKQNWAMP